MPGTAILDPNVLVDSLVVDVIDGLRGELHPPFGVRAYRVFTVLRTWSGLSVGEGSSNDVEAEILPQPKVEPFTELEFRQQPCGLDEAGFVTLSEVSLTYKHSELLFTPAMNQQWMMKIAEAHGQAQPARYFVHTRPPFVDREKTMGWLCWLRHVEVPA